MERLKRNRTDDATAIGFMFGYYILVTAIASIYAESLIAVSYVFLIYMIWGMMLFESPSMKMRIHATARKAFSLIKTSKSFTPLCR